MPKTQGVPSASSASTRAAAPVRWPLTQPGGALLAAVWEGSRLGNPTRHWAAAALRTVRRVIGCDMYPPCVLCFPDARTPPRPIHPLLIGFSAFAPPADFAGTAAAPPGPRLRPTKAPPRPVRLVHAGREG